MCCISHIGRRFVLCFYISSRCGICCGRAPTKSDGLSWSMTSGRADGVWMENVDGLDGDCAALHSEQSLLLFRFRLYNFCRTFFHWIITVLSRRFMNDVSAMFSFLTWDGYACPLHGFESSSLHSDIHIMCQRRGSHQYTHDNNARTLSHDQP